MFYLLMLLLMPMPMMLALTLMLLLGAFDAAAYAVANDTNMLMEKCRIYNAARHLAGAAIVVVDDDVA